MTRTSVRTQQGFTLLEIMVVLVIMGVLVGFAVLGIGKSPNDSVREEGRRLEARISLAKENAVLEGRDLGLGFYHKGYSFFELQDDTWSTISGDPQLRMTELPDGMKIQLELESIEVVMAKKEPEKPQVFILSSGEATPFTLELSMDDQDTVDLSFDMLGRPIKDLPQR